MAKTSSDAVHDDVIELGGKEFKRVKNGLDEEQVVPFINELIGQRDSLVQREEHLTSLTKLAEKTITEADKLAEEIKAEAMKQAEADAIELVAKAEEQVKQMIEEKRTEIINSANEEAAAIKNEAMRSAELILGEQKKKIQPEIRDFVRQLSSQILSELEQMTGQVVSLESELENKLLQFEEETGAATVEADEIPDDFMGLIKTVDKTNTHEPEEKVALVADDLDITIDEGEPQWELEILPPMDIMKVMSVVTHLDSLPEVEKTEIIPRSDKPSIVVFLREPIQLTDIIRELPEVTQVTEEATDNNGATGSPKKLQIELSGSKPVSPEGK